MKALFPRRENSDRLSSGRRLEQEVALAIECDDEPGRTVTR